MRAIVAAVAMVGMVGPLLVLSAWAGEKASFDPKSAEKTLLWTAALWQPILDATKNANGVAEKFYEKEFDATVFKEVGKTIDWVMPVEQIVAQGLLLRLKRQDGPRYILDLTASNGQEKNGASSGKVIPVPEQEWVLKLRPGDQVRVTGTLTWIKRHGRTALGPTTIFVISDPKVMPVGK
jgi:hypothetical protein